MPGEAEIAITVHNVTATTASTDVVAVTAPEGVNVQARVAYYTDDFVKQVKTDHPGAPRLSGTDLPFTPPSDTTLSCPLFFAFPGYKNAYVASIMTVFFSLLSQLAGMMVTMDYAMTVVLTTKNPFVPFDAEEYQRLGDYYAIDRKIDGLWLYIILGLLIFVVMMASTQITSEFTRREWIYYQLLQHGTLVDFKNRSGHLQFIISVKLFWFVLAFTALMLGAINSTGFQFEPTYTTVFLFWTFHSTLKRIQEMETKLVNINAIVDKRSRDSLTIGSVASKFLTSLVVVDESAVRYHIKLILLEVESRNDWMYWNQVPLWYAYYTKETFTEKTKDAVLSVDFAKIGRHGYTKEDYLKRRKQVDAEKKTGGWMRSLKQCCFALSNGGSDFWASFISGGGALMDPSDSSKLKAFMNAQYNCYVITLLFSTISMFYPLIAAGIAELSETSNSISSCPACDCSVGEFGSGSGWSGEA